MAHEVLQVVSTQSLSSIAATTTKFCPIGAGGAARLAFTTLENFHEPTYQTAGVLSNLTIRMTAVSATATGTFVSRKNHAANGNMTITIPATPSGVGLFEDVTNTDTVTAGNQWGTQITTGAGGTSTPSMSSTIFTATTNTVSNLLASGVGNGNANFGSSTFYPICGDNLPINTTEANVKCRVRRAGTLKNFSANCGTNTINGASDLFVNKNGANTTQTLHMLASTPLGRGSDVTHTTTIAAGDDLDYVIVAAGTSGSAIIASLNVEFETTTGYSMIGCATSAGAAQLKTTTNWYYIGGMIVLNTTAESQVQAKAYAAFTFSDMTVLIGVAGSVTADFTFRKNAANGNQVINFLSTDIAGVYSDTTHTDVVATTDLIDVQCITGTTGATGTTTIRNIMMNSLSPLPTIPQTVWIEWEES